jgi:hypothetical protein
MTLSCSGQNFYTFTFAAQLAARFADDQSPHALPQPGDCLVSFQADSQQRRRQRIRFGR